MNKQLMAVLTSLAVASSCWAQGTKLESVSDTQGVSLEELTKMALARNKDLQAVRESVVQSEARLQQARLRPNPSLDISKTTDAMFANEGDTAFGVTFSQPFELGGKRAKRINVEQISIDLSKAQIADAERQLSGKLRALLVEASGAASRLDLFDRLERSNQQMVNVMEVRLRSGDASRLDSQLLAAQTNQVRAQRLAADNQLSSAMLQIRILAGLSAEEPLVLRREPVAEFAGTEESIVSQALANRPDLTAARLREQLEGAGIVLAQAQAVPNLGAFVRCGRESFPMLIPGTSKQSFQQDNVMEFGVSIPLPLFNREQGNIAGAVSRRGQARAEREALEASIRRDVLIAFRRYQTTRRTLEIFRTGVIQPNQDTVRIVQLAYNLGELRLLDVVTQQRTLIEAETSYAAAQTELDSALADLQLAVGR
jgi:cobalt-zinc-cadmium efflux system outer membrane protein